MASLPGIFTLAPRVQMLSLDDVALAYGMSGGPTDSPVGQFKRYWPPIKDFSLVVELPMEPEERRKDMGRLEDHIDAAGNGCATLAMMLNRLMTGNMKLKACLIYQKKRIMDANSRSDNSLLPGKNAV